MKLLDLVVPAGRDADLSCAPGVESYYSTWKTTAGKIFFLLVSKVSSGYEKTGKKQQMK